VTGGRSSIAVTTAGSRPGISDMAAHPLSQVARITHGRPTARPRLRLTRSSAVLIPQPRSMLSRVHEARSRFRSALVTNSFRAVSHVSRRGEFRCNNHWPVYSSPFTPVRARPRIRQAMASPGSSRRVKCPLQGPLTDPHLWSRGAMSNARSPAARPEQRLTVHFHARRTTEPHAGLH
jgi:hypothetical protein